MRRSVGQGGHAALRGADVCLLNIMCQLVFSVCMISVRTKHDTHFLDHAQAAARETCTVSGALTRGWPGSWTVWHDSAFLV